MLFRTGRDLDFLVQIQNSRLFVLKKQLGGEKKREQKERKRWEIFMLAPLPRLIPTLLLHQLQPDQSWFFPPGASSLVLQPSPIVCSISFQPPKFTPYSLQDLWCLHPVQGLTEQAGAQCQAPGRVTIRSTFGTWATFRNTFGTRGPLFVKVVLPGH